MRAMHTQQASECEEQLWNLQQNVRFMMERKGKHKDVRFLILSSAKLLFLTQFRKVFVLRHALGTLHQTHSP